MPWLARTALVASMSLPLACANASSEGSCDLPAPDDDAPTTQTAATTEDGPPLRLAITVDDLPRHGPLPPGVTRLDIHRALLAAIAKHGVPQVYGFTNTAHLDEHEDPDDEASLQAWVEAGHPLGNHSYSHPHMREVGVTAYLADIDANEAHLQRLSQPGQNWHRYRYPFLEEGDDAPSAREVRTHLDQRGYQVAEVTVDFYDWAFNDPYVRCVERGDQASIEALRQTYLQHASFTLNWADEAAKKLFGRRIPHVLLVHAGAFDAVMFDELLTRYEQMGVEFISLDEALSDPVYEIVEIREDGVGGTLLEHLIGTRKADHPPWFSHPYELLQAICPTREATAH